MTSRIEDFCFQQTTVERVAFGMYVLDTKLSADHEREWAELPDMRRDLYLARARFVLSYADEQVTA